MTLPPPPIPSHILRSHVSPVNVLAFSSDNERLYSGDSSGRIVVTSTRSLRAIAIWNAHTDGLLGVEEWNAQIITHGRDNKIHFWTRIEELPPSIRLGSYATISDLPTPKLCASMDVNALNFCRFSLLRASPLGEFMPDSVNDTALIALPNLIDSSVADIWILPSQERLHASVGLEIKRSIFSSAPEGRNAAGIIMSIHLFKYPRHKSGPSSTSETIDELRLLCAYENGSVTLRRYTGLGPTSVEGANWEVLWNVKLHVESIMAMRVAQDNTMALTISVDNLIGKYLLSTECGPEMSISNVFRTKHAGNACITIRDDGKICAIGGWDGKIRLYSTRTFKSLGTLKYHKSSCQAIEFAKSWNPDGNQSGHEFDDDEMDEEEKIQRSRWLVGGSKDNRVSIWSLIGFENGKK